MLQNLDREEGRFAFAWHQNVFISAWWETATIYSLTRLQGMHRTFADSTSGPLLSLSLLYHTLPRHASKDERRLMGEISAYQKERFLGMFFFIKGSGLIVTSLRMLLSAIQLISRSSTPIGIYNSLPEAVSASASTAKINESSLSQAIQSISQSKAP